MLHYARTETAVTHPVIDGHNDLLWQHRVAAAYDFERLDLRRTAACRAAGLHTDLPRLRLGGVGAQFWSVWVPTTFTGAAAVTATLEQIDAAHRMIDRYAEEMAFASGAGDIERAWGEGRIACLLGAEGGHQIDESLGTLRMLHRLGVRYLTLTHNDNVPWADSATDQPVLGGLSEFGIEVIREMNRIGMLVDLSHVSAEVMRQALQASSAPVVFSHSSARAVTEHPRNVPDDVLERLPHNGGVCMATFVPHFVNNGCRDWQREAEAALDASGLSEWTPEGIRFAREYAETNPPPRATIADVVAHLEHLREVAGIEHVGIGGDYDGVGRLPAGLEDVTGYPRLLAALAAQGWSERDLDLITHRNTLRVLGDAGLT